MRLAGEEPEALDAIVITHEHSDHVNGVAVTARKLGIPVYFTEGTHRAWMRWLTPRRQMTYAQWLEQCTQAGRRAPGGGGCSSRGRRAGRSRADGRTASQLWPRNGADCCRDGRWSRAPSRKETPPGCRRSSISRPAQPFEIGDIAVSPFTIPHDAADPVGFVFRAEGVRMAFATDLGYIPPNVKAQLQGVDLLLLESNHDLEMLRDGPYPWAVKQRVLSRVGHLSNEAAAEFLENGYDGQAAYVILAHLSESNNLPELARVSAERALNGRASLLANRLLLAGSTSRFLLSIFK